MNVEDFEKLELRSAMYDDEEQLLNELSKLKILEKKQIAETVVKVIYLTSKNEKRWLIYELKGCVDEMWVECTISKTEIKDNEVKDFLLLLDRYMIYTKLHNLSREEAFSKMKMEEING